MIDVVIVLSAVCDPKALFLNFVSSGKIVMLVPVPELSTGDATRLDSRRLALAVERF